MAKMKRKRKSILLRIAMVAFIAYIGFALIDLQLKINQKQDTKKEQEAELQRLQLQIEERQNYLDEDTEEDAIKRGARELGLIDKNEIIFYDDVGN